MKRARIIAVDCLWILCFVFLFAIYGVILNNGLNFSSSIITVVVLFAAFFIVKYKKYLYGFLQDKTIYVVCIAALLLGLLLRFTFLLYQDRFLINDVLSDTGVHWYGSQRLIENGVLDEEIGFYETVFPFLFSYTGLLAISMKIFGKRYLSILLLNILFDCIGAVSLFSVFQRWKDSKKAGMVAAAVWMLNPLEIVFCGQPLPIVVVNAVLLLAVNMLFFVFYSDSGNTWTKMFFWTGGGAALCGIILGIGNAFRPIFVILVIATILYYCIRLLQKSVSVGKVLTIVLLLVLSMYFTDSIIRSFHANFNPYYHHEGSQAGWNALVGANYESQGRWSAEDRDNFFGPVIFYEADRDIEEANRIFFEIAKERYRTIIADGNLCRHLFNKLTVLFGDVNNSFRDVYYIFGINRLSNTSKMVQDVTLVYYYSTLLLFGQYVKQENKKKNKSNGFDLYLAIVFLGLFSSSVLVEVMNRYSLPLITILTIFAIAYLVDDYNTMVHSTSKQISNSGETTEGEGCQ